MKTIEKGQTILTTTNYDMFKIYEKNRDIKPSRVKRTESAIDKIDLTDVVPVIVNEDMVIVDGQGRFEACKKLGLPVYYVEKNLNGQLDLAITTLNTNQVQWSQIDYIQHYSKCGLTDYDLILECQKEYQVTNSTAVCFVGNVTTSASAAIRGGKFKKGRIKYSVFGDILMDFKGIFKDYNHVFFIRALVFMVMDGEYDHEIDFKRFIKHKYDMTGCATVEQYLKMMEDILNFHRRGDNILLLLKYTSRGKKTVTLK